MTSAVPSTVKNIPTTPKKPTKNGPTQKSNRSPPSSVPPRTLYFRSKLSIAMAAAPQSGRRKDEGVTAALARRGPDRRSGRQARQGERDRVRRLVGLRTFQPVEPVGREQDEVDQQRQDEEEGEQSHQRAPRIEKQPDLVHPILLNRSS